MTGLCRHEGVGKGKMGMTETDTGGDMTMEEGRIGGKRAETTIIKGKMIEVAVEENGLEIIIMVKTGKIRGGKDVGKNRLYMREVVKGEDPTVKVKKPKTKEIMLGKV